MLASKTRSLANPRPGQNLKWMERVRFWRHILSFGNAEL
jgi:hypothetical protein